MKALALISGGLDGTLAAKVIQDRGIEIIPINFRIPFCHKKESHDSEFLASAIAVLGLCVRTVELAKDFLDVIRRPRYGFGSQMNPCIDCKILMLSKAREMMEHYGAQFVVTGEVVGQRPMSQHRQALLTVAKCAGLEGLVVRPLSAKLLPETIPERQGWLDRETLLDFSGRGRKSQLALAKQFAMRDYEQPAGGCLLTDPLFSRRLEDIIEHGELNLDNVALLKTGRHFRLGREAKLAVGRNEKENNELEGLMKPEDCLFWPQFLAGPTGLGRGAFDARLVELSMRIIAAYCRVPQNTLAQIACRSSGRSEILRADIVPLNESELTALRI